MEIVQPTKSPAESHAELNEVVGRNLRRLRTKRGYSLEKFAQLSGVSRGMLSQIELGKSTPTIGVLWKIATALDVPFATFMTAGDTYGTVVLRSQKSKVLQSTDGKFASRALFPFDGERKTEFYEISIAAGHEEVAQPHASGTVEDLVVAKGLVEVFDGRAWYNLEEGDAILFDASLPHSYRNPGAIDATVYLVMTYVEAVG